MKKKMSSTKAFWKLAGQRTSNSFITFENFIRGTAEFTEELSKESLRTRLGEALPALGKCIYSRVILEAHSHI